MGIRTTMMVLALVSLAGCAHHKGKAHAKAANPLAGLPGGLTGDKTHAPYVDATPR